MGHEPDLGLLAAALMANPVGFPLRKGAVLALETDGGVPGKERRSSSGWRTAKGRRSGPPAHTEGNR